MKSLVLPFMQFIYPRYCLHCDAALNSFFPLLCDPCKSLVQLEDQQEEKKHFICFNEHSPAYSLWKFFLKTNSPNLQEMFVSWALIRLDQVCSCQIDVLVTSKKTNPLAKSFAKKLQVPLGILQQGKKESYGERVCLFEIEQSDLLNNYQAKMTLCLFS